MQQVRQSANLRTDLLGQHQAFVHSRARLGRELKRESIQYSQIETESNQLLTRAVVEIAGDAPAFFVLKLQQTARELTQGLFVATELVLDAHSFSHFIDQGGIGLGEFLFPMSLLGQVSGDDADSLKIAFSHRTKRERNRHEPLFILPNMPDALHLLRSFLNFL